MRTTAGTIFVVLPAYNEEKSLALLLPALHGVMAQLRLPYHVLVVNDGSQDGTGAVARQAASALPLEVVEHSSNRGLAAALRTGLRHILQRAEQNDIVITMDADMTHPPHVIPRMLAKLEEGCEVVIASRFQPGAVISGVPWDRFLYSLGARFLFQSLFPIPGVRDYTCAYRLYRAGALQQGFAAYGEHFITERGFACVADFLLKLRRLPIPMGEVPLELHYERRGGDSKMNVRRTIFQTLGLIVRRRLGRYG
jgi:dolichol-phosphate mannosyltransferase